MSQRREKEETEFKTVTLCINNCGVVGNPATKNMCQKCFSVTSSSTNNMSLQQQQQRNRVGRSGLLRSPTKSTVVDQTIVDQDVVVVNSRVVNRCSGCRKRVGLTGFRCRCGDLFCGEHRYSDRHDCSYDYKTDGREAIARDNPVVKAAKIVRI